jgi:hypothetical protein
MVFFTMRPTYPDPVALNITFENIEPPVLPVCLMSLDNTTLKDLVSQYGNEPAFMNDPDSKQLNARVKIFISRLDYQ